MITLTTTVSNNGSIASARPSSGVRNTCSVYKLLFNIAVSVELADVSPEVFDLLLVLNAGESHFGAWNLRHRIFYVILERLFIPYDARALVGIGILKVWHCAGFAAIKAIELRANFGLRAGTNRVAD